VPLRCCFWLFTHQPKPWFPSLLICETAEAVRIFSLGYYQLIASFRKSRQTGA
jgi:hypothetical protein